MKKDEDGLESLDSLLDAKKEEAEGQHTCSANNDDDYLEAPNRNKDFPDRSR